MRLRDSFRAIAVIALLGGVAAASARAEERRTALRATVPAPQPLRFEENRGQLDPQVRFVSRSTRDTLFLTADEAVLALKGLPAQRALRMRFRNASASRDARGVDALSSVTYYATAETRGRLEPARAFRRVRYSDIYPGVDLEYYRAGNHLEFDLHLAPHASAGRIELGFAGTDTIVREPGGDLVLTIAGERVVLERPVAFQERDGARRAVDADYVVSGTSVRFALGDYDPSYPLVIDPLIVYASYLGSAGDDEVVGAELDAAGNLYLFGRTDNGPDFPHTEVDPAQQTIDPINCFVSKVSAIDHALVYSVVFEGFGICEAFEVEGERVHVAMQSQLGNFGGFAQLRTLTFLPGDPVTVSPLKGAGPGQIEGRPTQIEDIRSDGFGNTYLLYHQLRGDAELQSRLMKVDAAGVILGTYDLDVVPAAGPSARAIAVDNFGQVFVVGSTSGAITPTADALQAAPPQFFNCPENGFLIGVDTGVEPFAQSYASYIAGDGCDSIQGIVRDPLGHLYLAGRSTSGDLPFIGERWTGGPGGDGFVIKLAVTAAGGVQAVAGTFLGLQLGTGSEGVADVYHPLVRLPTGELALTGGALGSSFPLQRPLFDATGAPGYPRFLQILEPNEFLSVVASHLDSTGAATHAVAAAARGAGLSIVRPFVFAVTQTSDAGLSMAGAQQASPAGGEDLLIRKIELDDVLANTPPIFDLGDDRTIEAADINGADFDLSCVTCSLTDFSDLISQLIWNIDGVRYTLTEPFVGQVTLPVGRHLIELVVVDAQGGATSDTLVLTVEPPATNRPPTIALPTGVTILATSPEGAQLFLPGSVSDPDEDPLDLTWTVASWTVQASVFPPYFSNNAAALVRLPIGTHVATLAVSDRRGQIVTAQMTIVVGGVNTLAGTSIAVSPVDNNFPLVSSFTPGRVTVLFDSVTTEGLTWLQTRTDQSPPPPESPQPLQLGSAPLYFDLGSTAVSAGNTRVCIDTTGMSFVDRAAIRLYRHDGSSWQDVTAAATAEETAASLLCGLVSPTFGLGTFAIFTPADASARVTTIIGNGDPFTPGDPAPGDGGPAHLAPVGVNGLVFDAPRQLAYVGEGGRIRRVDLQSGTITTIAGNSGSIADEQDGADARDVPVSGGPMAVDRDGNLFIIGVNGCSIIRIDRQTNRIRRVAGLGPDPATLGCRDAGDGGPATQADLNISGGMAFDADGNLFFVQVVFGAPGTGSGKTIRRIASGTDHLITGGDPAEIISTVAGGGTEWPPQPGDPRAALIDGSDIAFNAQGDLYIGGTAVVVRVSPAPGTPLIDGRAGELLTLVAGQALVTSAPYQGDGGPALQASFDGMRGIEILSNGDLAIADSLANRIRLVTAGSDGVVNGGADERVSTLAGFTQNTPDFSTIQFNGDGYALATAFKYPVDVVVDPRGGIDVVDAGFNRVRHIGPFVPAAATIDLAVSATSTSAQVHAGEGFSYLVTVASLTPQATQAARLTATLDANVRFDASTPQGLCTQLGQALTCDIGPFAGNGTMDVRIHVTPLMLGTAIATFAVSNPEGDSNQSNNTATVTVTSDLVIRETVHVADAVDPRPAVMVSINETIHVTDTVPTIPIEADLSVVAAVAPGTVDLGGTVRYTATVANNGPAIATGVTIRMPVPGSLTVTSIVFPSGACAVPLAGVAGTIDCTVAGPVPPGSQHTLTVDATPPGAGVFTTTFSVRGIPGDPTPANNESSASVDVRPATDVAIAAVPSHTLLNVGETLSYTVAVTNNGSLAATGVQVIIPAAPGIAIDQINLPPFSCFVVLGLGSWTCGLGDLAPGARVEFTVDAHATAGPSATVTFGVSSAITDAAPGNNTAVVTVAVNRPPVVDAGPDRDIVVGTSPAAVAVSANVTDPDGDAMASVAWLENGAVLANGLFAEVPLAIGTHTLTVVASDPRGGQGTDTIVIVVRPATLARPAGVLADSAAPGQVTVVWSAVPGAAAYRVYRDVDPVTVTLPIAGIELLTGNASLVATVTDTSWVDNGLPALVRQHYAVVAVNGPTVSQPTAAAPVIVRAHPDATIFGFADMHSHQFANLGFGRSVIWGSAFDPAGGIGHALASCDPAHGHGGVLDLVGNFLTGSVGHDTRGFDPTSFSEFSGWPSYNSRTHQQMYYESVRRAFEGGQRLMVMHAESNKMLCQVRHDPQFSCEDMASVEQQINEAKRLESFIDSQSGGPGRGWYRIAYTGAEARQIINSGKMAVVLGIEVDELFGCGRNATCTLENVRTRLDYFHDLGVRHLFPVGHFDNAFGSAAMYNSLYSFGNWATTGSFFSPRECGPEGYRYAPNASVESVIYTALRVLLGQPPTLPSFPDPPFVGDCNSRPLTGLGDYLVREMMARGMIIDIDHMSALSANRVLTIAEEAAYPAVVSGHSSPLTVLNGSKANEGAKTSSQISRIYALGGLAGILPAQGDRWTAQRPDGVLQVGTAVANDCGQSSKTFAQAFLAAVDAAGGPASAAVALGTDFNGLGGQPGPRFGNGACPGDPAPGNQASPIQYPFSIVAPAGVNAGRMGKSAMPQRKDSTGTPDDWDYNLDGLAHAGLVPDMIEDLRRVGVSDAYLQPLFRSAEAYVRMWERADGTNPPFTSGTLLSPGAQGAYQATSMGGVGQPVTATFASIEQEGYLVAEPMENPPAPPSGFAFVSTVFDIIATATYAAPIDVCIQGTFAATDRLVHFESDAWMDITIPNGSLTTSVCGRTSSLSPFAVVRTINAAPVANAGEYAPVEATSPGGATVTLSGTASDPDADPLTFTWTEGSVTLGTGQTIAAALALGTHDITLTVDDGRGGVATAGARVIVRDTIAPAIVITSPADGATFTLGEIAASSYGCTDAATGVDTCAGPVPSGGAIDTSSVGLRTFVVSAADRAGNAATISATYRVSYGLCLLYDPGKVKKSGSTVPIKLQLCDASGGNRSAASITLHARGVTLLAAGDMGPAEDAGNANPDAAFRYDEALAGYIFNLKTTGYTKGLYGLTFTVGDDPTVRVAEFRLQ